GEEERVVSGECPIAANMGGAVEQMWKWQAKGAPLVAVAGSTPVLPSYFQLGVPKNSAHPNLAKLFVAFVASKEGQAILEKHESVSSHLVEGTKMARYLRDSKIVLQEPKDSIAFYLKGEDSGLQLTEEKTKMMKQKKNGVMEYWNNGVMGSNSSTPALHTLIAQEKDGPVLSQEENELMTRVGPGTPAGEMLRRYWWPLAF